MTPERKKWWDSLPQGERELQRADLREANLRWADLREANLQGADLREADLRWADLREADLRGADLQGADLREADLQGADLQRADLRGADLQRADLREANLQGADLREADLRGVNLPNKIYQVVGCGIVNRCTTYDAINDRVICGCWDDDGNHLGSFKQRIEDIYGEQGEKPNAKYFAQYQAAIKFFESMVELESAK